MYKCQNCPRTVERNQPMNKIVIEKRRRTYENFSKKDKEPRLTHGWEIVKEIPACPQCFTAITGREARVIEHKPRPIQQRQQDNRRDNRRNKWKGNRDNRNRPDQLQEQRAPKKFNKERRAPEVQVVNPLKTIR